MHELNLLFSDLYEYMKHEKFKGYDPYDFLSSQYVSSNNKLTSVFGTQFLKYFPLNIRPFLGIEKKYNLKTLVLTVRSLIKKNKFDEELGSYDEDITFLFSIIMNNAKKENGLSWSRLDYDFYSLSGLQKRSSSIIYLTALVGHMCIELYEFYKIEKYLEYANDIGKFLVNVKKYENQNTICFYYTTSIKDRIFNASAYAAAFLSRLFSYTKKEKYLEISTKAFNYILKGQNQNGSWFYGTSNKRKVLTLIDYHQGFILDSLKYHLDYVGFEQKIYNSLKKGLVFYKNYQFKDNGQSIYRYPKKWPIDIHNQAQGIITFSRMGDMDKEYPVFSKKIFLWTLSNMYNSTNKFFYYQKWPLLTNKISYLRWGQAWMLFSLSNLISNTYSGCLKNE